MNCSNCDNGLKIVYTRCPNQYVYAFRCECPAGINHQLSSIPLWHQGKFKKYKDSRSSVKIVKSLEECFKEGDFESKDFKQYIEKFGREHVESRYKEWKTTNEI